MAKTFESAPLTNVELDKLDVEREDFLANNNDLGFETPVDPAKAKKIATAAFTAIAAKIESGHNID